MLWPMWGESADLIASLRIHGLDGFRFYADVWNLIDWCGFFAGLAAIFIWLLHVQSTSASSITDIVQGGLLANNVAEDEQLLTRFSADILHLFELLFSLHTVASINILAIIGKFFK